MPFTPFHFGPAACLKALLPSKFSFVAFCYAQVITDLEVAYYIVTEHVPAHRFTHTYVGAIFIALVSGVTAIPIHKFISSTLKKSSFNSLFTNPLTFKISLLSALLGTYSHVFLDSIMHADVAPFWPLYEGNPFLGIIPLSILHLICMVLGIIGILWLGQKMKYMSSIQK